ncbi:MAG: radical SAM protein, partial [Nanoarchaeota archaeon]|nr:radical SAM protein [Nanoarchaeota archaeon]
MQTELQDAGKLQLLLGKLAIEAPKKAVLSVTNECQMRCKMCYNWTQKDLKPMSISRWTHVVDDLHSLNPDMLINLIGGEPLGSPATLEMVRRASNLGMNTSLTTNAGLIDESMANAINRSGLRTLCLSLDSLERDKHDRFRGTKGAFDGVMSAIDRITVPEIVIQTIIMDSNVSEMNKMLDWAETKPNITGVFFMAIMKPHYTNLTDACLSCTSHLQ